MQSSAFVAGRFDASQPGRNHSAADRTWTGRGTTHGLGLSQTVFESVHPIKSGTRGRLNTA
jgi:hypothetical protein